MKVFEWENYRHVFAPAGARAMATAGVLARASISTVGLGILQLVSATRGGYLYAGLACGVYMVCAGLGAMFWGRLADLRGQRWVLQRTAALLGIGTFGVLTAMWTDAPLVDLIVAVAITGAGIPPAGAMVRARWAVLHAKTSVLGVAYAMESSLEEALFTIGPPAMGFLNLISPDAGLPLMVTINLCGMLWLAAQPGTEPPYGIMDPSALPLVVMVRGMPVLFATSFTLGGMLGALDVAVIAFAVSEGREQLGLVALGLWAAVSAAGGIAYGAMRHSVATYRRLIVTVMVVWVAMLPLAVVQDLETMMICLAVGATCMAPAMAVLSGLAEQISPRQSLTLALAWISAGTVLGAAAGTVVQGWADAIIGHEPIFVISIAFASAAAMVTWLGSSSLKPAKSRELASTPWSGNY